MNNEFRISNYYINESSDVISIDYTRPVNFYFSIVLTVFIGFLPIIMMLVVMKQITTNFNIKNLILLCLNNSFIGLAVIVAFVILIYFLRYAIKKLLSSSKEIFVIDQINRTLTIKFSDVHKTKISFDSIEHFWLIGNTDVRMFDEERYTEIYCIMNIHLKENKDIISYKFDFNNLFTSSDEINTIKVCQQLVKYISSKCDHTYTWRNNKTSPYLMEKLK